MKKIYMIGIGGIGLSALAQLYHERGVEVLGSDRERSPTVEMLENKGIQVYIGQQADQVPTDIDLLIYSDAVKPDNPERIKAEELGVRQISYFTALGEVARDYRVIAVSGTHGKTTVTAMLGKILIDAGIDPTVVVGSIVTEWKSNLRTGKSDVLVVEACEYMEHFLHFKPEVLVITNVEWDHTDYFKTPAEMLSAFDRMRSQSKSVVEQSDYSKVSVPQLLVPGEFNIDNAKAAKAGALAMFPDILPDIIDSSLSNFRGTWRRFEHKGKLQGGAELYDDYAHHPTAITKTIQAAKEKFPDKQIFVFFHPHLFSRTRDFFKEFAQSLSSADKTFVLPVYAAREEYDSTVDNVSMVREIISLGGQAEALNSFEEVEEVLRSLDEDVVAFTMGAGDVYKAGDRALSKQ